MLEATQLVTEEQIRKLFSPRPLELISFAAGINGAALEFDITSGVRLAAWLAQLGHESLGLTRMVESFKYSAPRLLAMFPKRVHSLVDAEQVLARGPEIVAERVYGLREDLGNVHPRDGWVYRGRGPTQLTGRANYARAGFTLGLPLEAEPDQVERPHVGFRVAGWFWTTRQLNALADLETLESFKTITRQINGGLNGWEDRVRWWKRARNVFGLPTISEEVA